MKKLIIAMLLGTYLVHVEAQKMTCDDIEEIMQLEERSWNENQELLDQNLFTKDYRFFQGDALVFEKFAGRAMAIQHTHKEIENFRLEILDHTCTEQRVIFFWKATGNNSKFNIPVKIFGMSLTKIRNGKAYEGISVHDALPSLLAAGLEINGPNTTKE